MNNHEDKISTFSTAKNMKQCDFYDQTTATK